LSAFEARAARERLKAEYDRLQTRLYAAYIDKLDGKIDAATYASELAFEAVGGQRAAADFSLVNVSP
jgi:hypothetical protein